MADLGAVADYRFSDIVKAGISLMNGEGYSDLQLDNSLKTSLGFTITPPGGIAVRIYSDIIRVYGVWQNTIILFAGIRREAEFIGAEFTRKTNLDLISGHNAYGFSATGGVSLTKSLELFTRFDYSTSSTEPGMLNPRNYVRDWKFLVAGLQKTFSEKIKLAIDFQGNYPYSTASPESRLIFLNALFSF